MKVFIIAIIKRLSHDKRGTVSFEYIAIAAALIVAVAAAFGGDTGSLATALGNGISSITTALPGSQSVANSGASDNQGDNPYWWFHANRGRPSCGSLPTAQERNFCEQGQK